MQIAFFCYLLRLWDLQYWDFSGQPNTIKHIWQQQHLFLETMSRLLRIIHRPRLAYFNFPMKSPHCEFYGLSPLTRTQFLEKTAAADFLKCNFFNASRTAKQSHPLYGGSGRMISGVDLNTDHTKPILSAWPDTTRGEWWSTCYSDK